jgi:hypothetical protein
MQKIILNSQPLSIIPPRKGLKHKIHLILKSKMFKRLINFLFIFNFFSLMLYREDMNIFLSGMILFSSVCLALIYVFEIIAKIVCYGFRPYFKHTDFVVEFIITSGFTGQLLIKFFFESLFHREDHQIYLIFRALTLLRLMPVIRMLHSIQQLGKLFRNLYFSFGLFLNIFLLFLLVLSVYSILGCFLFGHLEGGKVKEKALDDYTNFSNFFFATMTFIKISTGDDWVQVMIETKNSACQGNSICESNY